MLAAFQSVSAWSLTLTVSTPCGRPVTYVNDAVEAVCSVVIAVTPDTDESNFSCLYERYLRHVFSTVEKSNRSHRRTTLQASSEADGLQSKTKKTPWKEKTFFDAMDIEDSSVQVSFLGTDPPPPPKQQLWTVRLAWLRVRRSCEDPRSRQPADSRRHAKARASRSCFLLEHFVLLLSWSSSKLQPGGLCSLNQGFHGPCWDKSFWGRKKDQAVFSRSVQRLATYRETFASCQYVNKESIFGGWILTITTFCRQRTTATGQRTSLSICKPQTSFLGFYGYNF